MIGVALKGLAGRKVRALLTALAVVIGVAMVSGTFVLTDTTKKAFDGIFSSSYDQTDAVIAGKEIVKGSTSGAATVPESLLAKVRALPEVAAGRRHARADRIQRGQDPRPRRQGARLRRRAEVRARQRRRPSRSSARSSSRPASSPRARSRSSSTPGPPPMRTSRSATPSRWRRLDRSAATRSPASPPSATSIRSAARRWRSGTCRPRRRCCTSRGASTGSRSPRRRARRPPSSSAPSSPSFPPAWRSRTARRRRPRTPRRPTASSTFVRYFLLGFGFLALFVGAFVIFNTLSITVAQRTREFATLRTLGALAQAGDALGRAGGPGDRAPRLRGRALRRARTREAAERIGGDLPEAGLVFAPRTSSSRSPSAP